MLGVVYVDVLRDTPATHTKMSKQIEGVGIQKEGLRSCKAEETAGMVINEKRGPETN